MQQYQNQNQAERRIADIKRRATLLMSLHEAPERYWDYAVEYAVELINHTAVERLQWRTPFERLQGDTLDISVFRFLFMNRSIIWMSRPNSHNLTCYLDDSLALQEQQEILSHSIFSQINNRAEI